MVIGNDLRQSILKRTGLQANELQCPREKSSMTPCVARDGDLAMSDNKLCVGCGSEVKVLLFKERNIK